MSGRRRLALSCALALVVAGCGGGETATTPATSTTPAPADRVAAGKRVFERSGCLACHQLGAQGNSGPGDNLTGVGDRTTSAEIRRSLVDAPAPMPSFRRLGRVGLDDLVAYLSSLQAGTPCPDASDCG